MMRDGEGRQESRGCGVHLDRPSRRTSAVSGTADVLTRERRGVTGDHDRSTRGVLGTEIWVVCAFEGHTDKALVSNMYKELLKLKNKKTTQFKKWAKDLDRHCPKENIQQANQHMKRC